MFMLTPTDIQHFKERSDAVSIYYKGDTLSGKDLCYNNGAEFKDLRCLPEEVIKNKSFMNDLIGESILLQYPDSSSWSTTYHIEYVQIKELIENPEDDNSEDYLIVFKRLMDAPDAMPERLMLYHELSSQFLSKEVWHRRIPCFKMWISPYVYNSILERL